MFSVLQASVPALCLLLSLVVCVESFQPSSKSLLEAAVDTWCGGDTTTNPSINAWDVSLITDMSELFKEKTT